MAVETEPTVVCDECGEVVPESTAYPAHDDTGFLCEECYYDVAEWCAGCCETFFSEDCQHRFVAFDRPVDGYRADGKWQEFPAGIYQVLSLPYYEVGGMSGGDDLLGESVRWVGDLPEWSDFGFNPGRRFCPNCEHELGRKLALCAAYENAMT